MLLPIGALLIALLFGVTTATEHEEESRDLKVLYDTRVNLTCADSHFRPQMVTDAEYQWLLPSGDLVDISTVEHVNGSRYSLTNNGSELVIAAVDRPDFGLYMCLVTRPVLGLGTGSVHHIVQWGVNVDGPYYGDLGSRYWGQAQVGLVAGAAVFVFMGMLCLNLQQFDDLHDRPDPEVRLRSEVKLRHHFPEQRPGSQAAYRNPAFMDDSISDYLPNGDDKMEEMKDTGRSFWGERQTSADDKIEPKTSF